MNDASQRSGPHSLDREDDLHAQIRPTHLDNGQPTYQVFKPLNKNSGKGIGRLSVDCGCTAEAAFNAMTEGGFESEGVSSVKVGACIDAGPNVEPDPLEGRPDHTHIVYEGSRKEIKLQAKAVFAKSSRTWPKT